MNEETIFNQAIELSDAGARQEFLDRACAGDERLRRRVDALLRANDLAGDFMDQPVAQKVLAEEGIVDVTPQTLEQLGDKPGDHIGAYRLIELLGEGGMGEVFRAEQTEPVKRDVALKIIKPGLETKEIVARFRLECQALAVMDHPSIAKVFEAGVTPAGRPYFVMELVAGLAITEFCHRKQLKLNQRIVLFLSVCDAIQHAHRRGIIHRDIKPSNILVTDDVAGAPGLPKVVDFGVAKSLAQVLGPIDTMTHVGQVIGTPQYMSPEQAASGGSGVDTRTDVYSLGVVLYELLTGTTPLGEDRLRKLPLSELLRAVREETPPVPSRRMSDTATTAVGHEAVRHTWVDLPSVRGELDWIVMKALEKDPARRYETPLDLAADLRRYLDGLPVLAGPPSITYRLRKLAARHRAALAVTALLLFTILAATGISVQQAVVATRAKADAERDAGRAHDAESLARERLGEIEIQKETAEKARRQAETIKQYVVDSFSSPTPFRDGADLTVLEVLEKSVARIDRDFPDDPGTRAELLSTFATTYAALGKYERATELYAKSLELCEQVHGPQALETLRALARLGNARSYLSGGVNAAISELERAATTLSEKHPASHKDLAFARRILAQTYITAGRLQEAESLARENLDQHVALFGDDAIDTAEARNILARALFEQAQHARASELWQRVVTRFRDEFGAQNARTQSVTMNLASCYLGVGRERESVEILEPLLATNRETFGPEHPTTLNTMKNLSVGYFKTGQTERAIELTNSVLDLHRRVFGPDHLSTTDALLNLGHMQAESGRVDDSLAVLTECIERTRRTTDPNHPRLASALNLWAEVQIRRKVYDQAIEAADESVRIRLTVLGPDHPDTLASQYTLARAYNQSGRAAEAAAVSGPALQKWLEQFGDGDPRTLTARRQYAAIQQRLGNHGEAVEQLTAILEARRQSGTASNAEIMPLQNNIAGCVLAMRIQADAHRAAGRFAEAEPLLLAAEKGLSHLSGQPRTPDGVDLRKSVLESLVRLYAESDRDSEQQRWRQRLDEYSAAPRL